MPNTRNTGNLPSQISNDTNEQKAETPKIYTAQECTEFLKKDKKSRIQIEKLENIVFKKNMFHANGESKPFLFRVAGVIKEASLGHYGDENFNFDNPRFCIEIVKGNTISLLQEISKVINMMYTYYFKKIKKF